MSLLHLCGVHKSFGKTAIIRGLDLRIEAGERHALIGPNGAGKSTLFHLISGLYPVSQGAIYFRNQPIQNLPPWQISRLGLARSFQVTNLFDRLSALDNLRCALLWRSGCGYSFWRLLSRQHRLNAEAESILAAIGLTERAHAPVSELAYAQQRALELGIAMAGGASLLLLDEPVAGMSHSESQQTIQLIQRISIDKTLLLIEHDMNAVFNLADRITVLAQGEVIATDTPERIRANTRVQEAYLGD